MKKKGRGMSWEEKRQVMLRIFHNTVLVTIMKKTVYNFQEIQKLSIKAGIPFPSVKEILKSLQDDNLIESQKIGAGVFFWSFPSKAFQIFKQGIQNAQKEIDTYTRDNAQLEMKIKEAQVGREDTQQREEKIEEIRELEEERREYKKEVDALIRFDPERVELLVKQNKEIKEKINFWTDNLQQFKKHIKKEMQGLKDKDIEDQYGIPVDLDYVE